MNPIESQAIPTSNRRDSELLSVTKNLQMIKNMRRESNESHANYMQKLSLTSVLTPSFAKGN